MRIRGAEITEVNRENTDCRILKKGKEERFEEEDREHREKGLDKIPLTVYLLAQRGRPGSIRFRASVSFMEICAGRKTVKRKGKQTNRTEL